MGTRCIFIFSFPHFAVILCSFDVYAYTITIMYMSMYVRAALYYLVCNKNDNNNICQKIKHFHFKLRARFSVRWPEQQIKMENETESEKK